MLCEIIDHYINIFFDEIQLEKENFVFRTREFGCPNRYSGLPNDMDTSLLVCCATQDFFKVKNLTKIGSIDLRFYLRKIKSVLANFGLQKEIKQSRGIDFVGGK